MPLSPAPSVKVDELKVANAEPVIRKQAVSQEKPPTEIAVDVVLKPGPKTTPLDPNAPIVAKAKTKTDVVPFEVVAHLDGYLMVRQGSKVSAIQIGQKLPDGRVLLSVSSSSYKAD
jgi:hypothetical protein